MTAALALPKQTSPTETVPVRPRPPPMPHGQSVPLSPAHADPTSLVLSRSPCFMCGLSHWLADCAVAMAYIKARRIVRIGSQLAFPNLSHARPHPVTRLLQTMIDEKFSIPLALP